MISEHDSLRLENLRHILDARGKIIETQINDIIATGESGKIDTETWEERQFIHILAAKSGWFSRKLMQKIELGNMTCACKKCHLRYEIPDDVVGVCCELCDGICPKCKTHDYLATGNEMTLFDGYVEVSPVKLRLGRAARRRRNMWRKGEIAVT